MSKQAVFHREGRTKLGKPFHYRASGLDNIYLANGVTIEETSYGPMVTIDNLNGLHHAIGLHIVEKSNAMSGAEFRFLRKQLGLTQAELGRHLRVTDQTIANYEKRKSALGPAESFMRGYYLLSILPEHTQIEVLKNVAERFVRREDARVPDMERRMVARDWQESRKAQAA